MTQAHQASDAGELAVAARGTVSKRVLSGSRHDHAWARHVHISSVGLKFAGSSRLEKRIDITGIPSPRVNKGVPHIPQNERIVRFPEAAVTTWVPGTPVTSTESAITMKPDANGAPLETWQSLQWQLSIASGALVHV